MRVGDGKTAPYGDDDGLYARAAAAGHSPGPFHVFDGAEERSGLVDGRAARGGQWLVGGGQMESYHDGKKKIREAEQEGYLGNYY